MLQCNKEINLSGYLISGARTLLDTWSCLRWDLLIFHLLKTVFYKKNCRDFPVFDFEYRSVLLHVFYLSAMPCRNGYIKRHHSKRGLNGRFAPKPTLPSHNLTSSALSLESKMNSGSTVKPEKIKSPNKRMSFNLDDISDSRECSVEREIDGSNVEVEIQSRKMEIQSMKCKVGKSQKVSPVSRVKSSTVTPRSSPRLQRRCGSIGKCSEIGAGPVACRDITNKDSRPLSPLQIKTDVDEEVQFIRHSPRLKTNMTEIKTEKSIGGCGVSHSPRLRPRLGSNSSTKTQFSFSPSDIVETEPSESATQCTPGKQCANDGRNIFESMNSKLEISGSHVTTPSSTIHSPTSSSGKKSNACLSPRTRKKLPQMIRNSLSKPLRQSPRLHGKQADEGETTVKTDEETKPLAARNLTERLMIEELPPLLQREKKVEDLDASEDIDVVGLDDDDDDSFRFSNPLLALRSEMGCTVLQNGEISNSAESSQFEKNNNSCYVFRSLSEQCLSSTERSPSKRKVSYSVISSGEIDESSPEKKIPKMIIKKTTTCDAEKSELESPKSKRPRRFSYCSPSSPYSGSSVAQQAISPTKRQILSPADMAHSVELDTVPSDLASFSTSTFYAADSLKLLPKRLKLKVGNDSQIIEILNEQKC